MNARPDPQMADPRSALFQIQFADDVPGTRRQVPQCVRDHSLFRDGRFRHAFGQLGHFLFTVPPTFDFFLTFAESH